MKRYCYSCGSDKTNVNNHGSEMWFLNHDEENNVLCTRCWDNIRNPIRQPSMNKRRILYKGKRLLVNENPRKGICSECGKTNCETDIHHEQYHDDDVLKDTVELCNSCHGKITSDRPTIKNQYGVFPRRIN